VADKRRARPSPRPQVRDALVTGIALYVRIVEAADGCKDVTEHVRAGHEVADLIPTWSSEPDAPAELAPDLWQFLGTADDEFDWIVPGLIERGDRLMLTGFEGLGKSMLTRQLAVTMAAGLHPFRWARERVRTAGCCSSTARTPNASRGANSGHSPEHPIG
jgi:hypothetical protein